MSTTRRPSGELVKLSPFRCVPADIAPRDVQDLMAYPFFSLAKSPRVAPIDFRMGELTIRVDATPEYGMATIWDADILIWAASQIIAARNAGRDTSRLMLATPREILTFIDRGTSARDYDRFEPRSIACNPRRSKHRSASRRNVGRAAFPGSTSGRSEPTRTAALSASNSF